MGIDLPPAVILAHGPGGLGAARCLGRRGVAVTAIAFGRDEAVVGSRWARRLHTLADGPADKKERRLLDLLLSLRETEPALLCSSDRMVEFVARNRAALAGRGYRFKIPADELLRSLNDKVEETRLVASLGVPVPRTIFPVPSSPAELEAELGPEIILKPRSFAEALVLNRANLVAHGRAEMESIYARYEARLPLLLAQEIIPGGDGASWVVATSFGGNAEMLACGIKRKIRMSPPHFGPSTLAISEWNPELASTTRRLGVALGYVGHANFEYRYDLRDGLYKYIETNPRIQANTEFDADCDVPTVWTSYLVALGREVPPCPQTQRDGVIFVDLLEDLTARIAAHEARYLVRDYGALLFRRCSGQYFAWDDPAPGLRRLRPFAERWGRGALRRLGFDGRHGGGAEVHIPLPHDHRSVSEPPR